MTDELYTDTTETVTEQVTASVPWYKIMFYKNGVFSKTATFSTIANMITLVWYALSMFKDIPISPLDPTMAVAVLGLANGTYVASHLPSRR